MDGEGNLLPKANVSLGLALRKLCTQCIFFFFWHSRSHLLPWAIFYKQIYERPVLFWKYAFYALAGVQVHDNILFFSAVVTIFFSVEDKHAKKVYNLTCWSIFLSFVSFLWKIKVTWPTGGTKKLRRSFWARRSASSGSTETTRLRQSTWIWTESTLKEKI